MPFYRFVNRKNVSGFYSWFVNELYEDKMRENVWLVRW